MITKVMFSFAMHGNKQKSCAVSTIAHIFKTRYFAWQAQSKPWSDCVKGKLKSTPACHLAMHVGRDGKSTAIEYVEEHFKKSSESPTLKSVFSLFWHCFCTDKKSKPRFQLISRMEREDTLQPFQVAWPYIYSGFKLVKLVKLPIRILFLND